MNVNYVAILLELHKESREINPRRICPHFRWSIGRYVGKEAKNGVDGNWKEDTIAGVSYC